MVFTTPTLNSITIENNDVIVAVKLATMYTHFKKVFFFIPLLHTWDECFSFPLPGQSENHHSNNHTQDNQYNDKKDSQSTDRSTHSTKISTCWDRHTNS